ncbi:MAG: hypothetical protein LUQ25_02640 [Methanoregulaceae archaeon]|nr:hypothetical protein [Methanoregulaceae archaeon]
MFKWFRGAAKKESESEVVLALADLPAWLDERESDLRERELEGIAPFVQEFSGATAEIRALLREFGDRRDQEPVHPKLDKVTRDSLPLFEKSIQSHTSRKFPEDPWDFYQAAAECLKGCIKSLNGPGRYLTNLYPEEMKAIRAAIDRAGRAVNGMTPLLKETRAGIKRTAEARTAFVRIRELVGEQAEARTGVMAHQAVRSRLSDEVRACDRKIVALEGGDEYRVLNDLRERRAKTLDESGHIEAEIRTALSTVLHVLRKAQNIASKDRREGLREIHRAVDLLESGTLPESGSLGVVEIVLPHTVAMIGNGEIVLKNREEKGVFSDTTAFIAMIRTLYGRYDTIRDIIESLDREIRHHPASTARAALSDERIRLVRQCSEESRLEELARQRLTHAETEIPATGARLATMVKEISGGTGVRLVLPDVRSGDT